ncbi:MAG: 2-oxoglutarate dehydrogenase E1 component [Spirochaetales bacterium]|nr:2-oxoglutarate dehydrogenase E1 component [Spirochaetales bacterium]
MNNDSIGIGNLGFAEELLEAWKNDPDSVPKEWDTIFSREAGESGRPVRRTKDTPAEIKLESSSLDKSSHEYKQGRVDSLVWAYRDVGYLYADTNPLEGYLPPELQFLAKTVEGNYEGLEPEDFGLDAGDSKSEFKSGRGISPARGPLEQIIASLRETYCSRIGVEILHIQNRTMRGWLIEKIEQNNNRPVPSNQQKKDILSDLIKTEELEHFIHSNYIGQKRFSLEGGEALIPAIHHIIDAGAKKLGIQEIVLGMAHRGRLNVLTNLMNKPEEEIFSTFEDKTLPYEVGGSGDVKYHLGFSTDHVNEDGSSTHVSLLPNPSHLEAIDAVVEGKARGAQRRRNDTHRKKVLPVLVHGDSAFTGQGVVAETFNLSQLRGYKTGGTIHIIVNNQIGFTTASRDSRSTFFCTDVAKAMPVPILHVNGNYPEHVARAVELAISFRQKFGYDVVVDIICYRKYGHNEADEPSFTHPIMYKLIENAKSVTSLYGAQLDSEGVCTYDEQKQIRKDYNRSLKAALESARNKPVEYITDGFQYGDWKKYTKAYDHSPAATAVPENMLREIGEKITEPPVGFGIHRKLKRILDEKKTMFSSGLSFDWGTAEALAFGSLLREGTPVRLSGEDSGRGTFSHRHAVWWNTSSERPEPYMPLAHLSAEQARFRVYDSPLSEFAVLGFEYGNSMAEPEMLSLWEAQFGDFVNGAQVVIDQFIAAGESKWDRGNGLVMLLPHGYEGQGPEHSYGHLGRFLLLCAEDNMQVCNLTTPAQYFHVLRRQMMRTFRKPLILMTPKSLLRSKDAVSSIADMAEGQFSEILDDPVRPTNAETVVLCSGKVFYDLDKRRTEKNRDDTAIIRMEQLYPLPEQQLKTALAGYPTAKQFYWVQEEPRNRGAWYFINEHRHRITGDAGISYIGRKGTASPATGSYKQHLIQLEEILTALFE